MTHGVIVVLAVLGVVGQVLAGLLVVLGLIWLAGGARAAQVRTLGCPGLRALARISRLGHRDRRKPFLLRGRALHAVRALLVPTDLHVPPLDTTLLAALFNDRRAARYLLPLPLVGAGVSVYHLLVENGVAKQAQACLISAPGGCATKWINEFGYVTIPTLALTGFALVFALFLPAVSAETHA